MSLVNLTHKTELLCKSRRCGQADRSKRARGNSRERVFTIGGPIAPIDDVDLLADVLGAQVRLEPEEAPLREGVGGRDSVLCEGVLHLRGRLQ